MQSVNFKIENLLAAKSATLTANPSVDFNNHNLCISMKFDNGTNEYSEPAYIPRIIYNNNQPNSSSLSIDIVQNKKVLEVKIEKQDAEQFDLNTLFIVVNDKDNKQRIIKPTV